MTVSPKGPAVILAFSWFYNNVVIQALLFKEGGKANSADGICCFRMP